MTTNTRHTRSKFDRCSEDRAVNQGSKDRHYRTIGYDVKSYNADERHNSLLIGKRKLTDQRHYDTSDGDVAAMVMFFNETINDDNLFGRNISKFAKRRQLVGDVNFTISKYRQLFSDD